MSDTELRHLFDAVLSAPPRDTTDVDAAIRAGRRRRHQRRATILLASVAVVAAIGVPAVASLPGSRSQSGSEGASAATTSGPVTADQGSRVTSARQLLGSWWTTELDGKDVQGVRDDGGRPLGVTFEENGRQLRWGANDVVNYHSGTFTVFDNGRFMADQGSSTLVGTIGDRQLYVRNPEAMEQATEARILTATPTSPRMLVLLTRGRVVAVYTAAPAGAVGHT